MDRPADLIRSIAANDTMLDSAGEVRYFSIGESALAACKRVLQGRTPMRIIDFPSGYGRALRWFRHEWPDACLYAVETDEAALQFVHETFDAIPLVSHPRLETTIPGDADLIFSGSLLTHFDEWQWDAFLALCMDALAPDGTLIFTTHGRVSALQLHADPNVFGTLVDGKRLLADYSETGFAYQPYDCNHPEFGVSLSSPEWIMRKLQRLPFGRVVAFEEQGWGQDLVGIRRNPWPLVREPT